MKEKPQQKKNKLKTANRIRKFVDNWSGKGNSMWTIQIHGNRNAIFASQRNETKQDSKWTKQQIDQQIYIFKWNGLKNTKTPFFAQSNL